MRTILCQSLIVCGLMLASGVPGLAENSAGVADKLNLEQRRGLVTSSNCPLTCRELRVPEKDCRQWQAGNTCYVEDMGQPAGHRSMIRVPKEKQTAIQKKFRNRAALATTGAQDNRELASDALSSGRRGLITSALCPYSCKLAGLTKSICRDWQAGEKCYVEDFTQPPGHRSMIRLP